MAFEKGMCLEDFESQFRQYCRDTNSVFSKKHARTVESANAHIKDPGRHYPPAWKYQSISFECKHFGSYVSQSTGKRSETTTFKTNCQAKLRLSANKQKNGLMITEVNLQHSGHPPIQNSSDALVYPEFRQLNAAQTDELRRLLKLKVTIPKIIDYFEQTFAVKLTPRDIFNHKERFRKASADTDEDVLTKELLMSSKAKDPGAVIKVDQNAETKDAQLIFIQISIMKEELSKYPSVIFLDATYKVNNRNMPLFSFLVVDGNHVGQVVAYALVINEQADTLCSVMEIFKNCNPQVETKIKTFVIDKDFSEQKAITDIFPHADLVLCRWHVDKAIQRSLTGYSVADKAEIMEIIRGMLHCSDEEKYENLKSVLLQKYKQFENYFMKNWDEIKSSWVGCFVRKKTTFGNLTNNFVESHNHKIKFVLDHYSSVPTLFEDLIKLTERKHTASLLKKSALKLKKKTIVGTSSSDDDIISQIYGACSPYAAKAIKNEYEKFCAKIYLVDQETVADPNGKTYNIRLGKCNCFVSEAQNLICAHLFAYRYEIGMSLFNIEDIPDQHKLSHYLKDPEITRQGGSLIQISKPYQNRILSANEKFRKAHKELNEIADILSQFGQEEFDYHLDMFRGILNAVKAKENVVWFSSRGKINAAYEHERARPTTSIISSVEGIDNENYPNVNRPVFPENVPVNINNGVQNGSAQNGNNESCVENDAAGALVFNDENVHFQNASVVDNDIDVQNDICDSYSQNTGVVHGNPRHQNAGFHVEVQSGCLDSYVDVHVQNVNVDDDVPISSRTMQTVDLNQTSTSAIESENLDFKLPTKVKKRGRPKLAAAQKKNARKRKTQSDRTQSVDHILKQIINSSLVPFVLKGDLLIDVYMLNMAQDIHVSLTHFDERLLQEYFTVSGWEAFSTVVTSMRNVDP